MTSPRFRRELKSGECLFREGDAGDCAYLLERGRMAVYTVRHHRKLPLAEVGPGAILGEMALINAQPRIATVEALEACELTVIGREYLDKRVEDSDPLLKHLLHASIAYCRELTERICATSPMPGGVGVAKGHEVLRQLKAEQALELAMERGEFELHYQPIVRLGDGAVAGFEALIRWHSPERGPVPPSEFIPLAEQSGLIRRLGHWVIETACADLARLGAAPLFVSVNLSERQLADPELDAVVARALSRNRLQALQLRLEITESLLMQNLDAATRLLDRCRALGVGFSLDDFGTGYSSLAYLHRLPVGTLKLDRFFIRDSSTHAGCREVLGAVVGLSKALGMDVVAEGVEDRSQQSLLSALGVKYAQGFLYSPGLPLAQAAQWRAKTS